MIFNFEKQFLIIILGDVSGFILFILGGYMSFYQLLKRLGSAALILFMSGQFFSLSAQNAEKLTVRYLPPEEGMGSRSEYYHLLLKLALEKTVPTYGEYSLVPAEKAMMQRDALKAMMSGHTLDVVHTMTDKIRERVLLPIRIPLVKGLIGVRLVMVKQENQSKYLNVKTVDDLKKYSFGQGHDWPDTEILRYNDIKVVTSPEFSPLFGMLKNDEFDGFPRAVFEIWDEVQDNKDKNLVVADGFYIYYPTAMYFFVRKDKQGAAIAKRIEAGLRLAIKDGSFDKLFNATMKPYLDKANLKDRVGIKLKNSLLPDDTPLNDPSLWYMKF
ncbi:hypothetical protein EP331_11725 [bacterium]|nr:MAG: hypothetical protein EP331_11725 [bacterium]